MPEASHLPDVAWAVSPTPVPYPDAVAAMEARVAAIRAGAARELVWLLEHPPLYTAGTSADLSELIAPARFPVFTSGRGGRYTYHGPGQRVAYLMLDVRRRSGDVRAFVCDIERMVIRTLKTFGVEGATRDGRVGVWVERPGPGGTRREDKIAAVGLRLRHWISFHGLSINVRPDLAHFDGIVPCGIREHGVTSLADLGVEAAMSSVDEALRVAFEARFGRTVEAAPPL